MIIYKHVIFFQGLVSLMLCIMTIKITNALFSGFDNPQGLNVSLNTYKGSNTYYRAGDNSHENLAPNFAFVSKENKATVNKLSSTHYIINGMFCKIIYFFKTENNRYRKLAFIVFSIQ